MKLREFKERAIPFSIDELDQLGLYISQGLQGLAICHHGVARSWAYADHLTNQSIPTAFLEGGLEALNNLVKAERNAKIKLIREVPDRYVVINKLELIKFADLVWKLSACVISNSEAVDD